jgi:hypothetical protein
VKRPHEDPACHCHACEAYDNRGSDVRYAQAYGTWETWSGEALTMAAKYMLGIDRVSGEDDASLRERGERLLRNPSLVPRSDQ